MRKTLLPHVLALAFVCALFAATLHPVAPAAAAPAPAANVLTFPATGHSIRTAAFINFFQSYGGVQTFGYPLAEETWENGHLVQYFERQRFEYHQENAGTEYEVLLGRLGDEYSRAQQPFATVAPFANSAARVYVADTHHTIAEPFLSFWKSHGGVRILGLPISEVINEGGLQVQYFERARFERHPENAGSAYEVLLSLLGKTSYEQHYGQATTVAPPQPAATLNGFESRLLDQINNARRQAGLGTVSVDAPLVSLARDRSADMANRNYFAHKTPDGKNFLDMLRARSIPFAMGGEIIAENNYPQDQTADQAFQGYMNSKEHHDIIMMGNWRTVGVGQAVNGQGMYYFTVIFVQPQ